MKNDTATVGSFATLFSLVRRKPVTELQLLEWVGGCTMGVLGALILALNVPWSGYGWILFLVSNLSWMRYAVLTKTTSIFVMQIAFTSTTAIGLFRWLA